MHRRAPSRSDGAHGTPPPPPLQKQMKKSVGRRDGTNKFMRSPVNAGPEYDIAYAGGQAFPDGSNVGRLDGSVVTVRLPRRGVHFDDLPAWIVDQLDHPRNGFLSDDTRAYDPR